MGSYINRNDLEKMSNTLSPIGILYGLFVITGIGVFVYFTALNSLNNKIELIN